jgi:predicted Zn finger-like uncharacterized protein
MNFDCPGCQAKYQIADEKVATKAVKMKCRKCETPILISSLGARRALGVSEGRALTMPPGMSVTPPGRSLAPPSIRRKSLPAQPTPSLGGALAGLEPTPMGDAPVPPLSRRPNPPSRAPLPRASLPPSRAAMPPPPSRAPASADSPGALSAEGHAPEPQAVERHTNGTGHVSSPSVARAPSIGPDLGGMKIQIRESDEAHPPSLRRMASKMPTVMWHVGVEGVVQGPMTRTELAERCQKGEVTKDALVWKDGMSGWAPLGNVDDLKELVAPLGANGRAAVGSAMDLNGSAARAPAPDFAIDLSPVSGVRVPAEVPRRDSLWARVEARAPKRTHIAFLAIAAAVFGGAMSFAFFGGQETKIVEKRVEVLVPGAAVPADNVPPPPPADAAPANANVGAPGPVKTSASSVRSADSNAPTSPAPSGDAKGSLKGLSGLSGLGSTGPQAGPTPGASSGSNQALDSGQIESTVSRYRNTVKRGCWQPALDARDKNAPSSARVNVAITVASSGAVKSVSSSGDPPGYRGLASCIQSRVSTWSFPPSSGSTTINVPFVFATQ